MQILIRVILYYNYIFKKFRNAAYFVNVTTFIKLLIITLLSKIHILYKLSIN